jgi:membrane protein
LAKIPTIIEPFSHYKDALIVIKYVVVFLSLFLTVCSLYYLIPNAKLHFFEVIPGAFVSVVLWISSGYLLSKYIIYYNQLNVIYGSLGSIIVTLIFFYIVNMIFIYGAEFNYLMSKKDTN